MGWTAPKTFTVGELLTAATMNQQLRDNMNEVWREVAYVEFTSSVSITTASTEGSPLDIVSAGAVTYAAVPTLIEFFAPSLDINNGGEGRMGLNLWEATDLGRLNNNALGETPVDHFPYFVKRRLTPSAGSKTYKVRGWATVNTQVVQAGAGGVATLVPGFIRVSQRGS